MLTSLASPLFPLAFFLPLPPARLSLDHNLYLGNQKPGPAPVELDYHLPIPISLIQTLSIDKPLILHLPWAESK